MLNPVGYGLCQMDQSFYNLSYAYTVVKYTTFALAKVALLPYEILILLRATLSFN